jgi:hypothetical protein
VYFSSGRFEEVRSQNDYAAGRALIRTGGAFLPQQRLYFSPDLHGHGALRGIGAVRCGSLTG